MNAVRSIRKGQVITHGYLSSMAGAINELFDRQRPPTQTNRGRASELTPTTTETETVNTGTSSSHIVWTEQSRVTQTVRVENPDDEDQYVDVERISTVTLSDGVNLMSLVFNNA